MMTLEQLKAQCPAAVKYIAPWGQKRAQEEERKAQMAAREQDIKQREELLTPTRRISQIKISNITGGTTSNNPAIFGGAANEEENKA